MRSRLSTSARSTQACRPSLIKQIQVKQQDSCIWETKETSTRLVTNLWCSKDQIFKETWSQLSIWAIKAWGRRQAQQCRALISLRLCRLRSIAWLIPKVMKIYKGWRQRKSRSDKWYPVTVSNLKQITRAPASWISEIKWIASSTPLQSPLLDQQCLARYKRTNGGSSTQPRPK